MKLKDFSRDQLIGYVTGQIEAFFPDGARDVRAGIDRDIDEALDRLKLCINAVRYWQPDEFDYLHSSQHCIFVYYLANTIWRNRQDRKICTKLFALNKALHGFDCFRERTYPRSDSDSPDRRDRTRTPVASRHIHDRLEPE